MTTQKYWTITDPGKVKTSRLVAQARELFGNAYVYDEENIDKLCPAPKKDLTVSFRQSYEPDKEFLGMSYNAVKEKFPKKSFITLRQYFILAMKVFREEGKYLDDKGWTICDGSRISDGGIPLVGWGRGSRRVCVGWCGVANADPRCGLREAVLLESSISLPSDFESRVKNLEEDMEKIKKFLII